MVTSVAERVRRAVILSKTAIVLPLSSTGGSATARPSLTSPSSRVGGRSPGWSPTVASRRQLELTSSRRNDP